MISQGRRLMFARSSRSTNVETELTIRFELIFVVHLIGGRLMREIRVFGAVTLDVDFLVPSYRGFDVDKHAEFTVIVANSNRKMPTAASSRGRIRPQAVQVDCLAGVEIEEFNPKRVRSRR